MANSNPSTPEPSWQQAATKALDDATLMGRIESALADSGKSENALVKIIARDYGGMGVSISSDEILRAVRIMCKEGSVTYKTPGLYTYVCLTEQGRSSFDKFASDADSE